MRILILTAATGGGHDMRAHAINEWMERLSPWQASIHRPLEQGHALYRSGVEAYNWIQRNIPRFHHVYFGFLEYAGLHRSPTRILGARMFESFLESLQPNVIISTHAHLNHGYFELARGRLGQSNVRCITYCGELGGGYGFSRHWVNPDADLFIGAIRETIDAAVALGMPESKVWRGGFLLSPAFHDEEFDEDRVREFIQEELELDPQKFILLLATGAAGANNHLRILEQLERRGKSVQVVALSGHDEKTFVTLEAWAKRASTVRLKVLRYRNDMPLILRSVSAVVARPGTGTTSEAIMSACPIIMNGIGGVMPQESVTVRFGKRHGVARFIQTAVEAGNILDDWERDPDAWETLKYNMNRQRPTTHPREILEKATDCRLPARRRPRRIVGFAVSSRE